MSICDESLKNVFPFIVYDLPTLTVQCFDDRNHLKLTRKFCSLKELNQKNLLGTVELLSRAISLCELVIVAWWRRILLR